MRLNENKILATICNIYYSVGKTKNIEQEL